MGQVGRNRKRAVRTPKHVALQRQLPPAGGENVVEYLTDGELKNVQDGMNCWLKTCPRFRSFLMEYADKIRKKIREASHGGIEDLKDVLFELEVAYLLYRDDRFVVQYERFGGGPDYAVTLNDTEVFNIEVKRVREAKLNKELDEWRQRLFDAVREVQSALSFSLNHRTLNVTPDHVEHLKEHFTDIVHFVDEAILTQDRLLGVDGHCEIAVPGFERDLYISLSKPSGKTDHSRTSVGGGLWPLYYKNEIVRFIDTICEKIPQLIPGNPNIVVINSGSSTHDAHHLETAIAELIRRLNRADERFFQDYGYDGITDFTEKLKRLTGIVFKSRWVGENPDQNYLWLNTSAEFHVSDDICAHLKIMSS
jgi:hypothetical protein